MPNTTIKSFIEAQWKHTENENWHRLQTARVLLG